MHLHELSALLDDIFLPGQFNDSCHNGLVIPGKEQVDSLLLGVSLNRGLIERALEIRADALLVHHGIFLNGNWSLPKSIMSWVAPLIRHDLSLFAYHLPLDAHGEFSHNRYLIDLLEAVNIDAFTPYGLIGDLPEPMNMQQILSRLPAHNWAEKMTAKAMKRSPVLDWDQGRWVCGSGPGTLNRVAVCSGRGGGELQAAAAAGAQLLITGEISEYHPEQAGILGISLIGLGHNLSETGGLWNLGNWLKKVTRLHITHMLEDNPL